MTNEGLDIIFRNNTNFKQGKFGHWEFEVNDRRLICVSDTNHNRMRIITPIAELSQLQSEHIMKCLDANFHTALDTKYAASNGVLWGVFMHPLKELTREQVLDAISQVYATGHTFGTSYSSSNLYFPS